MRMKTIDRRAALLVIVVLAVMVVVFDRISKDFAEALLTDGPRPFIPGLLDFRLAYNTGAAWGMFRGGQPFFIAMAVVVVLAVLVYIVSQPHHPRLMVFSLGLFIGGSIGNAADRLVAGQVVDFLNFLFIDFPIFNIADSCITIGVTLLMLSLFLSSLHKPAEVEANLGNAERDTAERDTAERAEGIKPSAGVASGANPERIDSSATQKNTASSVSPNHDDQ